MSEKTLEVLRAEAERAAMDVVIGMNDHVKQKTLKDLKATAQAKVTAYNDAVADEYYRNLSAQHGLDAVKMAIQAEDAKVPGVIGFSYKMDDDGVAHLEQKKNLVIRIRLTRMQEVLGKEYFHSDDWFTRINALSYLIAASINKDIGGKTLDYAVSEAAKTIELGADCDPTSKTSMVKAFQKVIDGIVFVGDATNKKGEPVNALKFTSENWCALRECLTHATKTYGEVAMVTPARCSDFVTGEIHLLLNKYDHRLVVDEK